MKSSALTGLLVLAFTLLAPTARAEIMIDYSDDLANNNFFGSNPTARLALEAAVADINAVLTTNLGAITNDVTQGVSGSFSPQTILNFDFSYNYTNPATGLSTTITDTTLSANQYKLFVGAQNLGGSTLGRAGPGGAGFSLSGQGGFGSIADAIADAEANHQHHRGDGPTMLTLTGNVSGDPYSFDVGATIGSAWFDQDTNNDGFADSTSELEASWHFDHTIPVAPGKFDFYSVALHETLHSLGIGGSDSWNALLSGASDWLGPEVIALNGDGIGVIDSVSGAHFATGLMSTRISDGMPQEVVMDPNILSGTRKSLTDLDLAILRDIGWSTQVTAIPEPSSLLVLSAVTMVVVVTSRRSRDH
ncbi:MAG: hypothetical protein AAF539_03250 [Planctomycetota bacterium]